MARIDNLEFLADVIPRTMSFKEYKEKKKKASQTDPQGLGQTTLDGGLRGDMALEESFESEHMDDQ